MFAKYYQVKLYKVKFYSIILCETIPSCTQLSYEVFQDEVH